VIDLLSSAGMNEANLLQSSIPDRPVAFLSQGYRNLRQHSLQDIIKRLVGLSADDQERA